MRKVTLICSVHREKGICNVDELLTILRAIEPDVLFEEMRPSDFDPSRLEAQAIARYLNFKSAQRVPVDRFDMQAVFELKGVIDRVLYLAQTIPEHQRLSEEVNERVFHSGFAYLNSVAFSTAEARLSAIEDLAAHATGDDDLIQGLERWRQVHKQRECEMVRLAYEYCRANGFDNGVLLVGAAHKPGVVREIERHASAEPDLIDWKLCL
jgi:hypothetical protein